MFVMSKQRVLLPSADGSMRHLVERDFIGEVPDWACETDYFRALVADGKLCVPESKRDRDTQAAAEKAVKRRRAVEPAE